MGLYLLLLCNAPTLYSISMSILHLCVIIRITSTPISYIFIYIKLPYIHEEERQIGNLNELTPNLLSRLINSPITLQLISITRQ